MRPAARRKPGPPTLSETEARQRFWARVAPSPGCWLWDGPRFINGYGRTARYGKVVGAHRVAWEFTYGPIPPRMCVLHRCDVRACVNPDHLFLGTHSENTRDMFNKGRDKIPRGDTHPHAKLCAASVREIRSLAKAGMTHADIAQAYGVSPSTIDGVVQRRVWKHVQ